MASSVTLDKLKEPLMKERQHLQKAKDAILEQLKVLKAEQVTIQRLIQAHCNGESGQTLGPVSPAGYMNMEVECSGAVDSDVLPELELEVGLEGGLGWSLDLSEEETTEDEID